MTARCLEVRISGGGQNYAVVRIRLAGVVLGFCRVIGAGYGGRGHAVGMDRIILGHQWWVGQSGDQ